MRIRRRARRRPARPLPIRRQHGVEPPRRPTRCKIVDFEFTPPDITVAAGTEVTFTNDDTSPHTATADDDSFDTGKLDDGGDSGSVKLDEPGTYSYFCEFHPTMKGTIEVE